MFRRRSDAFLGQAVLAPGTVGPHSSSSTTASGRPDTAASDDADTVLLVSNVRFDDPGGRAAKFAVRRDMLAERGWNVEILHVPQPYLRSFWPSVVRGVRRARRGDVDVVQSVNNPFHLHVVGFLVATLAGLPWVAELRDALTTDPDLEPGSVRFRLRTVVERLVATRSTRLFYGDGLQIESGYFRETYPDLDPDHVSELPYLGYVAETFADAPAEEYDRFTITYAGSFYEGWIEPYEFLDALGRYRDRSSDALDSESDPADEPELAVQFYGDWTETYQQAAVDAGVADAIETSDFVPHEEIVPILKGSDALLYVGGSDSRNAANVPSKLFDYLGARRPILAVVDPSFAAAAFVRRHDLGLVVPPDDPAAIADAIETLHTGDYEYDPDPAAFERYTREQFIDPIAEILDEAARAGE